MSYIAFVIHMYRKAWFFLFHEYADSVYMDVYQIGVKSYSRRFFFFGIQV